MALPRPFAAVQTEDQWLRCAHSHTALTGNVVELEFEDPAASTGTKGLPPEPAGLAFDAYCRLYRSIPEKGRIERQLWAGGDPLEPATPRPAPVDLFAPVTLPTAGDFRRTPSSRAALVDPRALAVDENQRLFIAETSARTILVFDLWNSRLLRRVPTAGRPVDLVVDDDAVLALLRSPAGLVRLDARTGPFPRRLPAAAIDPGRMALSPTGELFVLDRAGSAQAQVIGDGRAPIDAPFATDLEFLPAPADGSGSPSAILVLAFLPNSDFVRLRIAASSMEELPPLKGRGYNGGGIVRTPDNRIGFWTAKGFRHAVSARVRYAPKGRVTTFQLDSGAYRTQWGRLFLDACIPKNTAITVTCVATDEPPTDPPIARNPPANVKLATVPRPELSPAMPPGSLAPTVTTGSLYRRDTGRELPWARFADGDPFETYEAEILSEPGRYLWIFVELSGDTKFTPRLRSLRAEYPSHELLRRLPRIFSQDPASTSFLRRYLAMFDGALGELDAEASTRQSLLHPLGAPPEVLPWLGGFLGVVLDERWPLSTQRQVIREAMWLFRFRGTVNGLQRFLELYLGTPPILIEKFRLRGLGTVGDSSGPFSTAILGAGFRVGGAVGQTTTVALSGTVDDAFETHAHRFTVMIPGSLTDDQISVVQQILDVHRPAHTIVDVCTVGAGMRVGRGLMVELTSLIGRTGAFRTLQLGGAVLGRDAVVGRPSAGTVPGASVLGGDSRVG
jgi:phage tail-like protein